MNIRAVTVVLISFYCCAAWALNTGAACNGFSELCGRSYANVTYVGAHDSFANSTNPHNWGADQNVDVIAQLNLGVRLLQGQAHWHEGTLYLCHRNCVYYNGGTLLDYLKRVNTWMVEHPYDVVTLLITNKSKKDVLTAWDPIYAASGLKNLAHTQPIDKRSRQDWPTLANMIDQRKRVVVFTDYHADQSKVPYIHDEFNYVWEDQYSQLTLPKVCLVDRPKQTDVTGRMNLINHVRNRPIFGIPIPTLVRSDRRYILETNSVASIFDHSRQCAPLAGGERPNFVLLDFVDQGDPFLAARVLNNLMSEADALPEEAKKALGVSKLVV